MPNLSNTKDFNSIATSFNSWKNSIIDFRNKIFNSWKKNQKIDFNPRTKKTITIVQKSITCHPERSEGSSAKVNSGFFTAALRSE